MSSTFEVSQKDFSVRQEAAALLQQEPPGRGGQVLRAADGSPGRDPRGDHPAALQAAGQQAVGAVTQPAALDSWLRQVETDTFGRYFRRPVRAHGDTCTIS